MSSFKEQTQATASAMQAFKVVMHEDPDYA